MPYSLEKWLAGRWIAGPGMDDAVMLAKRMNRHHISAMINYLGEDFTRKADVQDAVDTYLSLIKRMAEQRVHGDISIKPTQIGLGISYSLMRENYIRIVERAKACGIFVWLDMEGPRQVTETIKVYLDVGRHSGGICIQSYLERSLDDVKSITRNKGTVRLVKGAYGYEEGVGMIRSRALIDANYLEIMGYLFESSPRFMIATHDGRIIARARALNREHRRNVSYSMLNGINNQVAKRLAAERENVALYVPFGNRWVGYSYRRLREMGHVRLILGSLFRSQQL
jgi:proline dehydrogenase